MKLTAKEIKQLTGAKTRFEGETALYKQLEDRQWTLSGRTYKVAGYDRRKDLVHFTSTWAVEGGAGHSRVGVPLKQAIDPRTDLIGVTVLH
jgi:hypothetical protein